MADNVTIPATGIGTATPVIATDDVGGVQYQRVKLDVGGDGATTPVTAAAPLPVVQTGTPGLPTGAATETTLAALNVLEGAVTETAPASDTASSGLNGRLQRIAQRLTSLIALLPAALGAGGGVKVDGSGTALPVSGTVAVTGVATETTLGTASASLTSLIAKFANAIEIAPAATTMTAGAYTALDQVGTLLTFASVVSANGRACRLESMYIGNKANTAPLLQLWLFNAAPTLTSPGDNNAWQPTDADMATLIDVIDSGQWYAGAATALNQWNRVAGLGRIVVTAASTSIFGYLVLATGGALTGASTTDLTVRLVVTPDV